jgi:hypothetical protein
MLKIKDDVDLKELEKFGFKNKKEKYEWYEYKNKFIEITIFLNLENECENKTLFILTNQYNRNYANIDILYDLIQAGLVEKVEE